MYCLTSRQHNFHTISKLQILLIEYRFVLNNLRYKYDKFRANLLSFGYPKCNFGYDHFLALKSVNDILNSFILDYLLKLIPLEFTVTIVGY